MYSNFENYAGSQQDQLAPPPDQLASASSQKGIKYNHEDWGNPINYYINLKNNFQIPPPLDQVAAVDPQVPNVQIAPTQPFAAPIQEKLNAACQTYKLCTQEQQMVELMVFRSLSQVDLNNYQPSDQPWIVNNIILEIVSKIRNIDLQMEQFVNNDLQQAPYDDRDPFPDQQMNSILKSYDPNQKQSSWVPYIYNF